MRWLGPAAAPSLLALITTADKRAAHAQRAADFLYGVQPKM